MLNYKLNFKLFYYWVLNIPIRMKFDQCNNFQQYQKILIPNDIVNYNLPVNVINVHYFIHLSKDVIIKCDFY